MSPERISLYVVPNHFHDNSLTIPFSEFGANGFVIHHGDLTELALRFDHFLGKHLFEFAAGSFVLRQITDYYSSSLSC